MVDMQELSRVVIAIVVYACQMGILSVAFSLNYITDEIPNFALGGIIGTGHLISWTIAKEMSLNPYIGLPFAFLVGGIINTAVFLGVIDRSVRAGRNLVLITLATIGTEFILTSFNKIWWYGIREQTPNVTMSVFIKDSDLHLFGYPGVLFFSVASAILVFTFIKIIFPRLNAGSVFVAVSENPELASIQGINIGRVKAFTWFISGGLACFIGAIFPLFWHSSPSGTYYLVTVGLVGSILGGVMNPVYAMIGGLLLGVLELSVVFVGQKFVGVWFGAYRPIIPILILALVLYFAPEGMFKYITSKNID